MEEVAGDPARARRVHFAWVGDRLVEASFGDATMGDHVCASYRT
jgi:hypothetical protein